MNISAHMKSLLVDEIDYAIGQMEANEGAPDRQLYSFSAVFGVLQRVFNLEFDKDLLVAHSITNLTYQNFKLL